MKKAEATLIYKGGYIIQNCASDSDDRQPNIFETDCATTLLARDYKGIANYGSNAVIEIWEIKNGH